jgi:hypothetical protein
MLCIILTIRMLYFLRRRIDFCGLNIAQMILYFIHVLRNRNTSSAGILVTAEALNVSHIHAANIETETCFYYQLDAHFLYSVMYVLH